MGVGFDGIRRGSFKHCQLLRHVVAFVNDLLQFGDRDICQPIGGNFFPVVRAQFRKQRQLCDASGGVFFNQLGGQLFHDADIIIGLPLPDTDRRFCVGGKRVEAQILVMPGVAHLFELAPQIQQTVRRSAGGGHNFIVQRQRVRLCGCGILEKCHLVFVHGSALRYAAGVGGVSSARMYK